MGGDDGFVGDDGAGGGFLGGVCIEEVVEMEVRMWWSCCEVVLASKYR